MSILQGFRGPQGLMPDARGSLRDIGQGLMTARSLGRDMQADDLTQQAVDGDMDAMAMLGRIDPQAAQITQQIIDSKDKKQAEATQKMLEDRARFAVGYLQAGNEGTHPEQFLQLEAQRLADAGEDFSHLVDFAQLPREQREMQARQAMIEAATIKDLLAQHFPQAGAGNVQSTYVNRDGQRIAVLRDGRQMPLGDDAESFQLTPEGLAFSRRQAQFVDPTAPIPTRGPVGPEQVEQRRMQEIERDAFRERRRQESRADVIQPPSGYRLSESGDSFEPVPGGPVEREIQAAANERAVEMDVTQRAAITVVDDTQRALDILERSGGWAAGAGSYLSALPGTSARSLQKHIDSIKGNIGIDSLLSIKRSGAGLGAIPQSQLEMLASMMGNLDAAQSPDELRYNLRRIEEIYTDIVEKTGGDPKAIYSEREQRQSPSGRPGTTRTRMRYNPETGQLETAQ